MEPEKPILVLYVFPLTYLKSPVLLHRSQFVSHFSSILRLSRNLQFSSLLSLARLEAFLDTVHGLVNLEKVHIMAKFDMVWTHLAFVAILGAAHRGCF